MKPTSKLLAFLALALGIHQPAVAVDFFWDGNSTTANADGGAGTWNTVLTNWDTLATGGLDTTWPGTGTDNDAVFGGTAGTVTVDAGGVTANSLTFNTASYSIAGGSLTLAGATPSVISAVSATISANLVGSAGLTKVGNGTLTLSGSNSGLSGSLVISGATLDNSGGVIVSNANAFGGLTSVDIQNNSFLQLNGVTLGSGVPISVAGGGGTNAPQGAIRGGSGVSVINGAVSVGSAVRLGNLGTSTTFNGAVTAAVGSGNGILFRNNSNQGTILTNASNYWEGTTTLGEGSVYFHSGALPATTNLAMAGSGNTWLETNGTLARAVGTGANQIQFNSIAGRINGFSARGGDLTVNLGGGSALTWGSGGFVPAILGLAGANATGTLTWRNPLDLNGANRTIDAQNGSAEVDAIIVGPITGATGSILTKSGGGVIELSGPNTYSGGTVIAASQGAVNPLRISHANALGTGNLTIGAGGNNDQARLELTGGITVANNISALSSRNNDAPNFFNVSGENTITSNINAGGGGSRVTFHSASGNLIFTGTIGTRQLNLRGEGNGELRGNVPLSSGYGINKAGGGTWIIAGNATYPGTTVISGGTLQIGKGGTTGTLPAGEVTNNSSLVFDRDGSLSVAANIIGTGNLVNRGPGTLTITGNGNTYSGGTTLTAGTLLASNTGGSALGTGAVTVNGGTLGGTGSFSGAATINTTGVLSPGASIGTLGTGALTLNTGSTLVHEINTTAATSDLLNINGDLALDGTVTLSLADLGTNSLLAIGTKFTLISYAGSWTAGDIFSGYADDSTFTLFNNKWGINYNDTSLGAVNGGAFTNAVTLTVIPEPGAALLGGLGLLALLRRRR